MAPRYMSRHRNSSPPHTRNSNKRPVALNNAVDEAANDTDFIKPQPLNTQLVNTLRDEMRSTNSSTSAAHQITRVVPRKSTCV